MAYITQDQKKEIAAILKTFVPKDWKYSLSIDNHSTIICTIAAAPVDLAKLLKNPEHLRDGYLNINTYWIDEQLIDGAIKTILLKIKDTLNLNNFDESDSQTDYFHVGHYIDIRFGKWDKPFKNTKEA